MTKYCDGDPASFRELYALLAPRLLGYLMRMTRDRTTAEDLLQQTFAKVHRARGAYVRGADPAPWIFAIAHRTFLDDRRRARRGAMLTDHGDLPEVAAALSGEPADVAAARAEIDIAATRAALAAPDSLPAPQREAVFLTKLDGRSVAEAAEIAGTTPGAMKVRAHRGYVALRRLLGGAP